MRPLVGVGMVGMGAVMIFGGITGRLAPMLAALFVPSALTVKGPGGGGFWDSIIGGVIPNAIVPGLGAVISDTSPAQAGGSTPAPTHNPFATNPGAPAPVTA